MEAGLYYQVLGVPFRASLRKLTAFSLTAVEGRRPRVLLQGLYYIERDLLIFYRLSLRLIRLLNYYISFMDAPPLLR